MQKKLPSFEELVGAEGGARGSRLPATTRAAILEHLRAGETISATARATGVSRDQVRTVKLATYGLTLDRWRTLKARLR